VAADSLKEIAMKMRFYHVLPIALSPLAMLVGSAENTPNASPADLSGERGVV
jgi:hypothetical protein